LASGSSSSSLPPSYYHDSEIYEREMDLIFMKRWLPVAREEDVPAPGSFVVRDLGSESIIVLRGEDGTVRAFHNTCRHRGAALLEDERGSAEVIQCRYHSWTYDLDGRLVGAPYMEGVEGFAIEEYGLTPVRLDVWQGFLFVNLEPGAVPLLDSLGDLPDKLSRFRFGEFRRACTITYDVRANWKIIQENNLECYHCPTVHPTLVQIIKWDSWKGEGALCRSDGQQQGVYTGASVVYREENAGVSSSGKREVAPQTGADDAISQRLVFYYQFPVLQINLAPDNLIAHYFWPVGPDRTRIQFEAYFDPRIPLDSEYVRSTISQWEVINQEDWHVSELNHRGTASRFAKPGLFNNFEFLVEDFDRYLLEVIGPPAQEGDPGTEGQAARGHGKAAERSGGGHFLGTQPGEVSGLQADA
jgi:glycine betaine catabolism A